MTSHPIGFRMARNPDEEEPINFERAERLETAMRSFVAGHPQGSVRRTVLYIVVGLCLLGLVGLTGTAGVVLGVPALAALFILANSDELL